MTIPYRTKYSNSRDTEPDRNKPMDSFFTYGRKNKYPYLILLMLGIMGVAVHDNIWPVWSFMAVTIVVIIVGWIKAYNRYVGKK